jgi:hypothetical protein
MKTFQLQTSIFCICQFAAMMASRTHAAMLQLRKPAATVQLCQDRWISMSKFQKPSKCFCIGAIFSQSY